MKTWLQSILLLRDDKQQVGTNSYPYLRVDSIAGCTVCGEYEQKLRERMEIFKELTKSRKSLMHTFITTYGVLMEYILVWFILKSLWNLCLNEGMLFRRYFALCLK